MLGRKTKRGSRSLRKNCRKSSPLNARGNLSEEVDTETEQPKTKVVPEESENQAREEKPQVSLSDKQQDEGHQLEGSAPAMSNSSRPAGETSDRREVSPPVVEDTEKPQTSKRSMDHPLFNTEGTSSNPDWGPKDLDIREKLIDIQTFSGGAKSSEDISHTETLTKSDRSSKISKVNENERFRNLEDTTRADAKKVVVADQREGNENLSAENRAIVTPVVGRNEIPTVSDSSRKEGTKPGAPRLPSTHEGIKALPEALPTLESCKPESSQAKPVESQAWSPKSEKSDSTRATEHSEHPLATITLKAYEYQIPGRGPNIRFDIRSKDFQKRTGFGMGEGEVYEIRGKIGEVEFTKDHLEKKGNHVIIMVPKERQSEIRPGRRYDVVIGSVEEKPKFKVESYGDGRTVLNFQPTILTSLGLDFGKAKESEVIALQVENLSRPTERMRTLFTRLEQSDSAARLAVTGLGWKSGDLVKVHKITDYSREDFVKGFNESRETKRARLLLDEDKLSLEVDGRLFPMTNCRYETHSLQVSLSAKVEPVKRELRFWNDGERYTPKIRDARIYQFRASRYELKIVHEGRNHMTTASRFRLPEGGEQFIISKPLDLESIRQNTVVLPRPSGPEGKYDFEVSPPLNSYADAWLRAPNQGQLSQRIGTLSEELASKILEESNWGLVRKHPTVVKNGTEIGSNKPGFDTLMRWKPSGELGFFEIRWQQDVDSAFSSAYGDVIKRITKNPSILENPEKGAYIGILDWRQNERKGKLYVKRVWPRERAP